MKFDITKKLYVGVFIVMEEDKENKVKSHHYLAVAYKPINDCNFYDLEIALKFFESEFISLTMQNIKSALSLTAIEMKIGFSNDEPLEFPEFVKVFNKYCDQVGIGMKIPEDQIEEFLKHKENINNKKEQAKPHEKEEFKAIAYFAKVSNMGEAKAVSIYRYEMDIDEFVNFDPSEARNLNKGQLIATSPWTNIEGVSYIQDQINSNKKFQNPKKMEDFIHHVFDHVKNHYKVDLGKSNLH